MPFHERTQKRAVLVCHRRSGKTVACINELIKAALTDNRPNARYAYVSPTYSQAKDIAWSYLKQFAGVVPGVVFNESELRVDFPNTARIRLYGADNADVRMRGLYFMGMVLDEYADFDPRLWGTVMVPTLADHGGWAVFIGTPKGHNAFFRVWNDSADNPGWYRFMLRASESGLLPAEVLNAARREQSEDEYAQEFECSFSAAVRGAYYARLIDQLESDGRLCDVPYDPMLPVHTAWDLGMADSTAIVMWQQPKGGSIRIIDYLEAGGHGLDWYATQLQQRGYNYGEHWGPHDLAVRELGTGKSRAEIAAGLGIRFRILPSLKVEHGIEATRMLLPRCWIDRRRCERLLESLRHYQERRDDKRDVGLGPLHDWSSHAADSVRYMATAMRAEPAQKAKQIPYRSLGIA